MVKAGWAVALATKRGGGGKSELQRAGRSLTGRHSRTYLIGAGWTESATETIPPERQGRVARVECRVGTYPFALGTAVRVRVKWCGKSALRSVVRRSGGKPRSEQDQIRGEGLPCGVVYTPRGWSGGVVYSTPQGWPGPFRTGIREQGLDVSDKHWHSALCPTHCPIHPRVGRLRPVVTQVPDR